MATDTFTCRWALLGLSNIAVTFTEDLLLSRDASDPIRHEIACVSTTGTAERARSWLADRKVPGAAAVTVYHSSDEMLEKGDFDVVYISTPHPLHYAAVQTALRFKRNVLVEKPATMNKAQLQKLVDEAKRQGSVLMEAMWTRYLPATQYLQQELLPQIGTVKRVFADLSVPIASPSMPRSSRLLDKAAGAGALLDMGVYALTWADVAFGGDRASQVVYADTIPYDTGDDLIDDINTIVLRKPPSSGPSAAQDGAVAIITTSLTLAGSSRAADKLAIKKVTPNVRIEATGAQVSIPYPLIRPQELHVEWYDEAHLGTESTAEEKHELISKPVERGWGLWYQADVIAKAVQGQKEKQLSGTNVPSIVIGEEESLRVLGWMDTVRQSAHITYAAELEKV